MGNSESLGIQSHNNKFFELVIGRYTPKRKEDPFSLFKLLLSQIKKTDIAKLRNARGEDVIMCSCYNPDSRYLRELINHDFQPSHDNFGNTALHIAVLACKPENIRMLCNKWPDMTTTKNGKQLTPIEIAGTPEKQILMEYVERGENPLKYINVPDNLKQFFIHRNYFSNIKNTNMSGGMSVIRIADLLTHDDNVPVVLKGISISLNNNNGSLMREMKILHHVLKIYEDSGGTKRKPASYAECMLSTAHPNIIQMLGFTVDDHSIFLVSPYTERGDLNRWILEHQDKYVFKGKLAGLNCANKISECNFYEFKEFYLQHVVLSFIQQIAKGLQFLHDHNVIHNDIKPMNCLIFEETDEHSRRMLRIKLIDFGLSLLGQDPEFLNTPVTCPSTIPFAATERLVVYSRFSNPPSVATDMFSFGATVWNLVNGIRPFYYTGMRTKDDILPPLPDEGYLGKPILDFVNCCISSHPLDRPKNFSVICSCDITTPMYEISDGVESECNSSVGTPLSESDPAIASFDSGQPEPIKGSWIEHDPPNPNSNSTSTSNSNGKTSQVQTVTISTSDGSIHAQTAGFSESHVSSTSHVPSVSLIPLISSGLSPNGDYNLVSPRTGLPDEILREIAIAQQHMIEKFSSLIPNNEITIIDSQQLRYGVLLGEGNFGTVYRGVYEHSSGAEEIAIKYLKFVNSFSSEEKDKIRAEFIKETVALTKFKNIERTCELVGISLEPMQIIMKFYPRGSIVDLLKNEPDVHYMTKLSLIKDIAEGLRNIHASGGVHRDIAARNILVDDDYRAYISDFGKTRFFDMMMSCCAGTTQDQIIAVKWAPPETFNSDIGYTCYSDKTDIWAFGVTVYEILVGEEPYKNIKHVDIFQMLRDQQYKFLELPETFDDELYMLVDTCLEWDPLQRGTMQEHYMTVDRYLSDLIKLKAWQGKNNKNQSSGSTSRCSSSSSLG